MCRSIKQLRRPAEPPTETEISAAALQYIRKVSGYRVPSRANQAAFEQAVAEVARATQMLLAALPATPQMLAQAHAHEHPLDHAHEHPLDHAHDHAHPHAPEQAQA